VVLCAALAAPLGAQGTERLTREAVFHKEPGGIRLATLATGARVTRGRTARGFVEVTVRGWIYTASTRADGRDGFDLSVAEPGGENLRVTPAPEGNLIGRAVSGALFDRVGTRGGWTEVRRTGWVPASAFAAAAEIARAPAQRPAPPPAPPAARSPPVAPPPSSSPITPPVPDSFRVSLRAGAVLQRGPDGDVVAALREGGAASIAERRGDWVRVQLDGWVRSGDIEGPLAPPPAITAAMLREQPDRLIGQTVDWRLQFVALQTADELRPELPPGARYLLTRGPLPETGFVYVLLSREQAAELQGLRALDELSATVSIRAARTRHLATPVVELVRVISK
jgi:hypothetical protein